MLNLLKWFKLALQVNEKSSTWTCCALCSIEIDQRAELIIANTRQELNDWISKTDDIQFFISAVTGTTMNSNKHESLRI